MRSNPLLMELNFKIKFYFNWITSLRSFPQGRRANDEKYSHCERSEAIHTNNNGFSLKGVAIRYLFLLILKINKIVNINNGKIIAKNIPAFNPI